jgi:preprotein translocase subunit SecD
VLNIARWRIILVVVSVLVGGLFAAPSFMPQAWRDALPSFLPNKGINLGLDLQGGSHLLFEVESQAVVTSRLEKVSDDMVRALNEAPRLAFLGAGSSNEAATVKLVDPAQLPDAIKRIEAIGQPVTSSIGQAAAKDITVTSTPDGTITVRLVDQAVAQLRSNAVQQSIEVIRRRIDETGTKEPSITRQGIDRIVVQAPGESDPERLKALIGQTAKLTFQMVDDSVPLEEAVAGRVPPGAVLLPNADQGGVLLVRKRALVDGESLVDAQASFNQQTGEPVVTFRFDGAGGRAFGRATVDNVGKRFAIILDDKIISAPSINEPILGGSGQISGSFTVESANDLALLLRAGALPAPLKVLEQRTVGPELGQDSINAGATAGVLAVILIVSFMALAYGFFGWIALAALACNVILMFGAMSIVGATLTLPGIAGFILTIGMAVDANVLLYERMREEYAAGRSVPMAIDAGFNRAVMTIMDANITTILAALILFVFGAGPVRGFAWTLSIGVVTSVFTAVLVTQILIAWWYWARKPKKMPI